MANRINRYTQLRTPVYNPLSLQEMAFAPSIMRQQHDRVLESQAATQAASQQYNVLDQYGNVASQLVEPLSQELTNLSSDLASKGVKDANGLKRAMDLRAQQEQLFGARGGIGQLQAASESFRARVKEIKDDKDLPEYIKQYKIGQLKAGEAALQEGKLSLGNMQDTSYVKHIDEGEILKDAFDSADKLNVSQLFKDEFPQDMGTINFTDIYKLSKGEGVTAKRAQQAIYGLIGQDQWDSVMQSGEARGLSQEQTVENFTRKLDQLAQATASYTTDDKILQIDNPYLKAAFDKQNEDGSFTPIIPGVAQDTGVYSKLDMFKPNSTSTNLRVEAAKILGDKTYPDGADYETRRIYDAQYEQKIQGIVKQLKDPENSIIVNNLVETNPQFKKLAGEVGKKKAIETYNNFYKNVGKNYTDVYGVSKGVDEAFIRLYKNRLDQYQVITPEGEVIDYESTGFFGGKNHPIDYSTLEIVGPTNKFGAGTMIEMRYKESEGDSDTKTIFVEPPKQVSAASIKSKAIDEMITNNEGYKNLGTYNPAPGVNVVEIARPNYQSGKIDVVVVPVELFKNKTDKEIQQLSNNISQMSKEELTKMGGGIMDANSIIQREVETGLNALTTKGTQYIQNTGGR